MNMNGPYCGSKPPQWRWLWVRDHRNAGEVTAKLPTSKGGVENDTWGVPKIGVPLVIIHFRWFFSLVNPPAMGGYPHDYGNPHMFQPSRHGKPHRYVETGAVQIQRVRLTHTVATLVPMPDPKWNHNKSRNKRIREYLFIYIYIYLDIQKKSKNGMTPSQVHYKVLLVRPAVGLHMATYMLLPRWRSQLNLSRIHA